MYLSTNFFISTFLYLKRQARVRIGPRAGDGAERALQKPKGAKNTGVLLEQTSVVEMDDPVWDHSTFSENRESPVASDVAAAFFERILKQATAENFCPTSTLRWTAPSLRPGPP